MNVHLSDSMTPRRGERNIFNCDSTQSIFDTFSQRPGGPRPSSSEYSSFSLVTVNCNYDPFTTRLCMWRDTKSRNDIQIRPTRCQPLGLFRRAKSFEKFIDNSSFRVVSRWYGSLKLRYALIPTRSRTRETTGMPSAYFRTDFPL